MVVMLTTIVVPQGPPTTTAHHFINSARLHVRCCRHGFVVIANAV